MTVLRLRSTTSDSSFRYDATCGLNAASFGCNFSDNPDASGYLRASAVTGHDLQHLETASTTANQFFYHADEDLTAARTQTWTVPGDVDRLSARSRLDWLGEAFMPSTASCSTSDVCRVAVSSSSMSWLVNHSSISNLTS